MTKLKTFAVAAGSLVSVIALSGTALADTTVTVTVGPVPIPGVPVEVCVTQTDVPEPVDECVTTPPAQSVSLTVIVHVETPEPALVPPTVTPIPCPAGTQGVAAQVFTGSAAAAISGSVTVVLNDGTPVTIPIDEVVAGGGQTLTVFACAGLSPGVPVPPLPLPPLALPGL
jgi:hypothetical protein